MINKLKKYLVTVFGISSVEANGLVILFILMLIIFLISLITPRLIYRRYSSFLADKKMLDSLAALIESDTLAGRPWRKPFKTTHRSYSFPFDPNEISIKEMDSLGFSRYLAERIEKYRNSGGRFRKRDDLKKIYGMQERFYLRIKPFILLPDSLPGKLMVGNEARVDPSLEKVSIQYDINIIDSTSLTGIRGIGPVLASRIIKYRSRLGGFINIDQLDEIYGLKDQALVNVKKDCFIPEYYIPRRININFAEWADLVHHPYFDKNLASEIINCRDKYGPFRSSDDLSRISSVSDSILVKIQNYISY